MPFGKEGGAGPAWRWYPCLADADGSVFTEADRGKTYRLTPTARWATSSGSGGGPTAPNCNLRILSNSGWCGAHYRRAVTPLVKEYWGKRIV
jgi:hypothetical protein